jgi:hypothetical protein
MKAATTQLRIVGGDGFQRVVADARVAAAHEQHRLRHHLVQLHRVVAGAAGHAVDRQAERLHGPFPALLPGGVARCGRSGHRLFDLEGDAAAVADALELGQHVGGQRVACGVGRCPQVEAELAAAGG